MQKLIIFDLKLKGRMEQESGWDKPRRLVVTLPNGTTKTIGISQGSAKRYWFGICPISFKIGNLKMCGGCQIVGYVGKEEQVRTRVGSIITTLLSFIFPSFFCRRKIGLLIKNCAPF